VNTVRKGDLLPIPNCAYLGKVVSFRAKVRGPFIDDPEPGSKLYPVVVEQGGAYRMATLTPKRLVVA